MKLKFSKLQKMYNKSKLYFQNFNFIINKFVGHHIYLYIINAENVIFI